MGTFAGRGFESRRLHNKPKQKPCKSMVYGAFFFYGGFSVVGLMRFEYLTIYLRHSIGSLRKSSEVNKKPGTHYAPRHQLKSKLSNFTTCKTNHFIIPITHPCGVLETSINAASDN